MIVVYRIQTTWETLSRGPTDEANAQINERLDRFLANESFLQLFPNVIVQHLNWARSDHCPIMLYESFGSGLGTTVTKRLRVFRFEEIWTQQSECKNIIIDHGRWTVSQSDYPKLESCLQQCRVGLQKWGKGTFANLRHNILKFQSQLQDLYKQPPPWDFRLIKNIEDQLDQALENEEIYWKQRSRENWLKQGDKNTKWFHKHASMRKKRNEILGISNSSGAWISDRHQMEQTFENYFTTIFASANPSSDVNSKLCRIFL